MLFEYANYKNGKGIVPSMKLLDHFELPPRNNPVWIDYKSVTIKPLHAMFQLVEHSIELVSIHVDISDTG